MVTLYLTEQGATLHKDHRRFIVEHSGVNVAAIQDFKVDRVVIIGQIQLTTQAVAFLLSRGIDTAFLNIQGQLKGRLAAIESKNVPLRVRQYELAREKLLPIEIAKRVVVGKVTNAASVLTRYQKNHLEVDFSIEISRLAELLELIDRKRSLNGLRGIEGQAAAIYFDCYSQMFRRSLTFTKRNRRPPKDPVNAMLSLGYTLLYNEAIGALASTGFDPYIGFFHGISYGRCSLALDIIEEFRHITIDRLVLNLANLDVFTEKDFYESKDGGVYLYDEQRKRFLKEYEKLMNTEFTYGRKSVKTSFRKSLHDQALSLQRTVLNGVRYEPFRGWL